MVTHMQFSPAPGTLWERAAARSPHVFAFVPASGRSACIESARRVYRLFINEAEDVAQGCEMPPLPGVVYAAWREGTPAASLQVLSDVQEAGVQEGNVQALWADLPQWE